MGSSLPGLLRRLGGRRERGFVLRETDERPDIVLFMTDEQRHDEVGYASGGYFETPALDALAARGVVFETAYSGSTVCVPSRTSLLTGLHPHRTPTGQNGLALREGFWTIARALRGVGYRTALVGKMHFSPMYADHGFDVMKLAEHLVPYSGYGPEDIDDYHRFLLWEGRAGHGATHLFGEGLEGPRSEFEGSYFATAFPHDKSLHPIGWIARTAIDLLNERTQRRAREPLFLVVSFPRPHAPYDPAEPYASMYDPKDARPPQGGFEANAQLPAGFREAFVEDPKKLFNPWPSTRLEPEVYRRVITYVRALVRQVDDAMAEVLARLDLGRSVVFFTSDHGTYGGHRGLLGKVPWVPFDDLARVPFLCAAPGAMAGKRVKVPVQSLDFALTCLDYAGIEPPPRLFDAVSLRQAIQGQPLRPDRAVFCATSVGWPMVRRGDLKLIRGGGGAELLFDLARDPAETTNVLDDPSHAATLASLRHALDANVAAGLANVPPIA